MTEDQRNAMHDIEALLAAGKTIQLHPQGCSMYPLFVQERDEAVIAPIGTQKPKRGDVVLYRREQGILVLHRVCRVTKKGLYMVGDNQIEVEGPLRPEQVKGILVGIVRKGSYMQASQPLYVAASRIWLFLRPVRRPFQLVVHFFKQKI